MKGVVLSGGLGTRLEPLTLATNKQLLPVYNKPMIYYPIATLRNSGIKDILLVANPENINPIINLLGSGRDLNVNLQYGVQESPLGGLANGLAVAENFVAGGKLAFILGDNIFEDQKSIKKAVDDFEKQEKGAKIAIKKMPFERLISLGVVKFDKTGKRITEIVEKPKNPPTEWASLGFYLYDNRVFDFIRTLKPSARDQYEITDLSTVYAKEGTLTYQKIGKKWIDAGTFDALLEANVFMAKKAKCKKEIL